MPVVIGLLAGVLFGAGLAVSDMINPARVLNFLDVAGSFDPSLAFVMAGALGVTFIGYRLAFMRTAPAFDTTFHLPTAQDLDARLLAGAAIFGVGWGLAGICPGPGLAVIVSLEPKAFVFVVTMLVGIIGASKLRNRA
jgi:uncharacterized membrane protein YedE/YeeE